MRSCFANIRQRVHLSLLFQTATAKALQNSAEELAALYDLSRALAAATDTGSTLEVITQHAANSLHVTFARIGLVENGDFVIRAVYPIRVLAHNLELGRREPVSAHPMLERYLARETPLVLRAQDRNVPEDIRALVHLGFAQTMCLIPLRLEQKTLGLLMLGEVRRETREPFSQDKLRLALSIGDQAASALHRMRLREETERQAADLAIAYDATIEGWSRVLDLRDNETEGHTQRVTGMTMRLGNAMGMEGPALNKVRYGALLHDIGKMGVPDNILFKPGPLTDAEWVIMRRHPVYAYELLSPIAYLGAAIDIPYCHHEKWDGTGYPRGLTREEIPPGARIFAVVDVWDALRSDRPYRRAWQEERVHSYIRAQSGAHFDPRVVEMFFRTLNA